MNRTLYVVTTGSSNYNENDEKGKEITQHYDCSIHLSEDHFVGANQKTTSVIRSSISCVLLENEKPQVFIIRPTPEIQSISSIIIGDQIGIAGEKIKLPCRYIMSVPDILTVYDSLKLNTDEQKDNRLSNIGYTLKKGQKVAKITSADQKPFYIRVVDKLPPY